MARIERASPEVVAPVKQAVLIDPNAFKFTGAGEGLKAIGGVLTELGERRKKAQDSLSITETNNSQSLAQAEIKQFMVDNPNPDDWEVGIEGILQKQDSVALQLKSSPETRARIVQSQKAFREQTLLDSSILQTEATISIDVQSSGAALIAAMGTGDELAIEEARDTHEAALLRKEAPEIAAISLLETLGQGEKQRISVLVEQGLFEEARKLTAKTKGLEPTERIAQLNFINSAETRAKNAKADFNAAIQNQTMTETIQKLADTPNDFGQEDFDALPLNDANKTLLADKINQRATAIEGGKADPWIENTSNTAATSAISRVLDGTREEVSKTSINDIIEQIGTITPAQASELIAKRTKRLDATNVINTPAHQRAVAALNRLRDARLGADDVKDDIELRNEVEGEFGRAQNELEAFAESIEGDPDFDAKILKKQQFLGKPIVEKVTLNWFEKMFSPKEQGFFSAVGFNTEAEELVQEKMDILKDQKVWKTLNDAEKESARKRFEQGQTVQEILDLLNGQ